METKLIKRCLSNRAKSRLKRNDLVVVLRRATWIEIYYGAPYVRAEFRPEFPPEAHCLIRVCNENNWMGWMVEGHDVLFRKNLE